jgi:mono/diheme cytochrome c family protein
VTADRRLRQGAFARPAAVLALGALVLGATACDPADWLTDFKQQPSIGTWQPITEDSAGRATPSRGMPQGSVPVTGVAVASWQVGYDPLPGTIDSLAGTRNPVEADARSLENGRKVYAINCAVCHGYLGDGDGAMRQLNPMYGFSPSLLTDITMARTDGYLFGMMRNGRGLMPPQNRIPERDRWDVVNYLRGLQGRYAVETGPVGFPGQTGTALPGHTAVGPTVPAAFVKPTTVGTVPKPEKPKTEGAKAPGGH